MATSLARVEANRKNAQLSTGPRTPEGKERSRANAYKHGLTGQGVVLPEADATEIDRRYNSMCEEFSARSETSRTLVRRLATLAVRLDRCVKQQNAAQIDRLHRLAQEFQPPEDADEHEAARLYDLACHQAMFDTSREGCLARSYEAAAERGFFRVLRELKANSRGSTTTSSAARQANASLKALGSFLPPRELNSILDELPAPTPPQKPASRVPSPQNPLGLSGRGPVDIPITIGKPR